MDKTTALVNGSQLSISIKMVENGGNFKAIANVNFGWFEVVGFRISHFKDYTRNKDCLRVEPPKYGRAYKEAFRTTASIKDEVERDRARKGYWYHLEDAIIEAYYWAEDKGNTGNNTDDQPDKTGKIQENSEEATEEINLDEIPF